MASDNDPSSEPAFVERRAARDPRAFPGGPARLPRINRPSGAPPEELTEEEPLRRDAEEGRPAKDQGFEAYYSSESLFETHAVRPVETEDGPYAVLGLPRSADWERVSKAHRRLVSQLHPDRYVGDDDAVREAAERRVRDVNEAYATIRRERAVQRA